MPVSEGEEIETWGDPGRGTVIKPTDESGVSKAVPLCCWNGYANRNKKKGNNMLPPTFPTANLSAAGLGGTRIGY